MTQRLINMHVGIYTKTLCDDLRKGLLITLTLLFVCPGVWGAVVPVSQASDFGALTDGKYTLVDGTTYNVSGTVELGGEIGGYLEIPTGAHVTIHFVQMWSAINRQLSSVQENGYVILNNGYLTISGIGFIQGGKNSGNGGGIYNNKVLNLEGAAICGNTAQYGGGIYNASGAEINMTTNTSNYIGYNSYYNNAVDGGGIYNDGGTVNISESITRFQFNRASNKGGGIYNASGNLILTNGEFTQNLAAVNGGGIYLHGGELRIGGGFTAYDNRRGTSYATNQPRDNVYLPTGKIINVISALNSYNGARVTMETLGTLTNDLTSIGDMHNKFSSDEGGIETYYDNNDHKVKMRSYWSKLQDQINTVTDGETISLTKSYDAHRTDGPLSVTGKTVTINLNGYSLDRNLKENKAEGNVISVASTGHLTISGSGTIKGGNNSGNGGGIVNEGELTMNGGTISGNTSLQNGGGIYSTGTLNIQGGTITGNAATTNGGGIYHDNPIAASFNMQGAPSITGNLVYEANNNIYIPANNVITRSDALTGSTETIGISVPTPVPLTGTIFTSGLTTNEYLVFKADDTNYDISRNAAGQARYQTPWLSLKNNIEEGVEVKLTKNYTAPTDDNLAVGAGNTTTLDLNGFTIDRGLSESAAAADGYLINIPSTATLTIKDTSTSGNGRLTGGKMDGNGGCIINEGTLNIQSGIITGNSATGQGGAIYNNGTLNISGGTINNNSTTGATKNGGAIYNETTATLDISGGTISGNQATGQGGAIYNASSNFTLSGGTISSNTAACEGGGIYNHLTLTVSGGTISSNNTTGDSKDGGGIYNANSGTLNIQGGTIQNNIATGLGGGVYVHAGGSINMRGEPTITGNTVGEVANNVYLPTGKTITIDGALSGDGKVGISVQAVTSTGTVFTSSLSGNGSYTKFSPDLDNTKYETADKNGEAQVQTYWTGLQTLLSAGGSVTLTKNYTAIDGIDTHLGIPSGKTVNLNLNGYTINRNLSSSSTDRDYVIQVQAGATLTITGVGTNSVIKGGYNTSDAGGVYNSGELTINGAYISNNTTTGNGGGVYNVGTLTMTGGTISNNTATGNGGGVYHAESSTAFNLSGNPTISSNTGGGSTNNVYLYGTKTITVTAAITGGSVGVFYNTVGNSRIITTGFDGETIRFFADVSGFDVAKNSDNQVIVGKEYAIGHAYISSGSLYINGQKQITNVPTPYAIQGEQVKVKISVIGYNMMLYNLTYNPNDDTQVDVPGASYPKNLEEYTFLMPAKDVSVEAVILSGCYCGDDTEEGSSLEDVKCVLDRSSKTLKFIPKDNGNYKMKTYSAGTVTWCHFFNGIDDYRNGNYYTDVYIPKNLIYISPYAFVDFHFNCRQTSFSVDADNPNYKAVNGVLFSKDGKTLISYPSGKTGNTYDVPGGVTDIAYGAFASNSNLQSITATSNASLYSDNGVLYNSDKTILFSYPLGKNDITEYTVPLTVQEIRPYAFACEHNTLKYIYMLPTNVPIGGPQMFYWKDDMLDIYRILVKTGCGANYKAADIWNSYQNRIYEMNVGQASISNVPHAKYINANIEPLPTVTMPYNGRNLVLAKDVDYTVAWSNNKNVGTATVTITGKPGSYYEGSEKTVNFVIYREVEISGVTGDYATYIAAEDLQNKNESNTAYPIYPHAINSIDWSNNTIEIVPISYIPKNVPVLLKRVQNAINTTYHFTAATDTPGVTYDDEHFFGVSSSTDYASLKTGSVKDIYILKGNYFYRATGGTLAANRCYIVKLNTDADPAPSPAPAYLSIITGDNNTTSIVVPVEEVFGKDFGDWYTLDGRKLQNRPTQKGVYIRNGKKIAIK